MADSAMATSGAGAGRGQAYSGPLEGRLSLAVVVAALVVVVELAAQGLRHPGAAPHFGVLADAFLHGRLYLSAPIYDQAVYHGHVYLPFGPLPAVLLMPLVPFYGTD